MLLDSLTTRNNFFEWTYGTMLQWLNQNISHTHNYCQVNTTKSLLHKNLSTQGETRTYAGSVFFFSFLFFLSFPILVLGCTWREALGTCVLTSDFGFTLNCAFKKSGLFRVRNLGGVKGYVGLGECCWSPWNEAFCMCVRATP